MGSPYGGFGCPYQTGCQGYSESWQCPHGFVSAEHRSLGPELRAGLGRGRLAAGLHLGLRPHGGGGDHARRPRGGRGWSTRPGRLGDLGVLEFRVQGTAVRVTDGPPPADGRPWTTYLAGQRLAKLIEAGYAPVSIAAARGLGAGLGLLHHRVPDRGIRAAGATRAAAPASRSSRHPGPTWPCAASPANTCGPSWAATRCTARRWSPPSASWARVMPSSSASCVATGCGGSGPSTPCRVPDRRCRLL